MTNVFLDIRIDDFVNSEADLKDYFTIFKDLPNYLSLLQANVTSKVLSKLPEREPPRSTPSFRVVDPFARDPLRAEPPVRPVAPFLPRGDFDGDLDPFGDPFGTGSQVGPNHPMFRAGRGRGIRRDPFGPNRGSWSGEPDNDIFGPPGPRWI
jgi:hypothetical protein